MKQEIRFCTAADGVRIAYATVGSGPVLLTVPGWISHLELDWEYPVIRATLEQMAKRFTLVRMDKRGTGLSDRGVADLSLEARVRDVEAVVTHAGLDTFFLSGISEGGPTCIAYAAANNERLRKLHLYGTFAFGERLAGTKEIQQAALAAVKAEWGLGSKLLTDLFLGDEADPALAQIFTAYQRVGATGADAYAMLESLIAVDVRHLLPSVTIPTQVVHARQDRILPIEAGRELATGLPDATFVSIDGPHIGFDEVQFREMNRLEFTFLLDEEAPEEPQGSRSVTPSGSFATILFTDMEGSTTLADRLGDDAAQEIRRAHNHIVRAALAASAGNEIKHTGDGIMASFATASAALDSAIAIQRGVAAHKEEHPGSPLGVYVGLNAGEPIAEGDPEGRIDLFGTSINLAARICDHAEAGQILAANVVRELAAGKQFLFADLGETELRGFEDPVKLWELRWQE